MTRWHYLLPNLFTAVSLGLGLASILYAVEGYLEIGSWLIIWGVLLDKADGTAARLLGATSRFGSEFDSMADLVSFGMAPAFLVYAAGRREWGLMLADATWLLLVASVVGYAILSAVRLARFNLAENEPGQRHFDGLPSTLCGAMVSSTILVCMKYEISDNWMRFFPVLMLLLGLGMISNLPVPKVLPRKNKAFNLFQILNILAAYAFGFAMLLPEYLLGLAVFYLAIGTVHGILRRPNRPLVHPEEPEPVEQAD